MLPRIPNDVWGLILGFIPQIKQLSGFISASTQTRRIGCLFIARRVGAVVDNILLAVLFRYKLHMKIERQDLHGKRIGTWTFDEVKALTAQVEPWVIVHINAWRMAYETARRHELNATAEFERLSRKAEAIKRRLDRRNEELREGRYGVRRSAHLRGPDDKRWTELKRDEEMHLLAAEQARPAYIEAKQKFEKAAERQCHYRKILVSWLKVGCADGSNLLGRYVEPAYFQRLVKEYPQNIVQALLKKREADAELVRLEEDYKRAKKKLLKIK